MKKTEQFQSKTESNRDSPLHEDDISSSYTKRISEKVGDFHRTGSEYEKRRFSFKDVEKKFGASPVCYLSGRPLDLKDPRSFHFDHIVPRSKGGSSEIENLGLATREANIAKSNLDIPDLLSLCEDILNNFGYTVTKNS